MSRKSYKLFISLIIFSIGTSCVNTSQDIQLQKNQLQNDEYAILNLVFEQTVGSDTIWTKYLKVPIPFLPFDEKPSKQDLIKYKKDLRHADSVRARLDTAKLFVFVNDSFIKLDTSETNITSMIDPESFKLNFPKIDTLFQPLVTKLAQSAPLQKFDLNTFRHIPRYTLDYISRKKNYDENKVIIIGNLRISNIIFDLKRSKACIYSELECGQLCGEGLILFFKKTYGKWQLAGRRRLWVS